jgi:catechol 2,3-dioxygenase-like lactoylglutathione lyase family enzyme
MNLGAFSVSLNVKDIAVSRAFYEALGFEEVGGNQAENWLILRNGPATIGLFAGMIETTTLTFNPGWNQGSEPAESFTDVRDLQRALKSAGLKLGVEADESTTGPGWFTLEDPDGNAIQIDQHV